MAEEPHTVSNATLYALLQTVHANQLKYDIPELAALTTSVAALAAKLAILDAKLDQIIAQVTPPETGDFNPETAIISPKE